MKYTNQTGWQQTTKTLIKISIFVVLISALSMSSTLSIVMPKFVGASGYDFPSTNELNRNQQVPGRIGQNAPHVNLIESRVGEVDLEFVNPAAGSACFEYRSDGEPSQYGNIYSHPVVIGDFFYYYFCITSLDSPEVRTFNASQYVEIRLAFGAERDWDFDWTKFNVLQPLEAPENLVLFDGVGTEISNGSWTNSFSVMANWDAVDEADSYEYSYWNAIPSSPFKEGSRYIVNQGGISRSGVFNQGEGVHFIAVRSISDLGVVSEWSDTYIVGYDASSPMANTIVLNNDSVDDSHLRTQNCQPIEQTYLVAGDIDLSAAITDAVSDVESAWYKVRKLNTNGCTMSSIFSSSRNNLSYDSVTDRWQTIAPFDTTQIEDDGLYTVMLVTQDSAGNQTTRYIDIVVDNTKPTHTIDSHISGDVVNGTFLLEGTASDGESGIDEVTVQINKITEVGGSFVAVEQSRQPVSYNSTTQTWSLSVNTDAFEDGVYRFNVNSVDQAGNERFAPNIDLVVLNSTITDLVVATPELSTLESAVLAANLDGTLADETSTFTVFAPVDSAFADLDAASLLASPDLAGILTYHVVEGAVLSSDLTDGQVITTLEGTALTVDLDGGVVFIVDEDGNSAQVVTPDIPAANGVVHLIDSVFQFAPSEATNQNGGDAGNGGDDTENGTGSSEDVLGATIANQNNPVPLIVNTGGDGIIIAQANDDDEDGGDVLGDDANQGTISPESSSSVSEDNGETLGLADEEDESSNSMTWIWALLVLLGVGSLFLLFARRQAEEE